MDKYSMLLKEYLNIVNLLIESDNFYSIEKGRIAIDKDILIKLLSKHKYLELKEKLKLWKVLNFFHSENGRFTIKRVVEKNNVKTRNRFMVINTNAFIWIKQIIKE